jgi:hypothetical protein
MINTEFDLCFDEELLEILTPEEIIYVSLVMLDVSKNGLCSFDTDYIFFCETQAYDKLLEYYAEEIPYGIAKYRTGEPDAWILERLQERFIQVGV